MAVVVEKIEQVINWTVDEVIEPVVNGIGDVFEYVLDNPVESIVKFGLTVTGNSWAIPLVDGAKTLAEGGDLGDALKATAISYAGGKLGTVVGKYVGNVANDFIGDSFASQVVSAGVSSGSKAATVAVVYGQDPLKAFATGGIQGALGATLGQIDNMMEGQFENLQDGVKDSIQAGVSSALGDGNISPDTVGNIVSTYSGVGDFMTKFLEQNTGMSNAAASVITTAVTNSVATALAGNPDMSGEAFFATMSEAGAAELKKVVDKPVNDAIDKLSGAYGDTEVAADGLNNAISNADKYKEQFNALSNDLNAKIIEQDALKDKYDRALKIYNGSKTEANAKAVNAAAKAFNDYSTALEKDYNKNYKNQMETAKSNYDFWNDQIPDLEDAYEDARKWMVTTSEDLADELKPVMTATDRAVALALTNGVFDEDAYRKLAGLDADADVYRHYLENQNLPTDRKSILNGLAAIRGSITDQVMALSGLDFYQLSPEQLDAFYEVIDKKVGSYKDVFSLDFEAVAREAYDAAFDATVSGDIYPQQYDKKSGVTVDDIAKGNAYLHIDAEDNLYKWMTIEQIEDQAGESIVSIEYNPNTNTIEPVFNNKTDGLTLDVKTAFEEAVLNGTGEATIDGVTYKFPSLPKNSATLISMVRALRDEAASTGEIPANASTFINTINEFSAEAGAAFDAAIGEPLYEATKNIYNAYIKDSTVEAASLNTTSIVLGASGEMLEAVSGLALIMGASPDNAVGRAAEKLLQLSGDVSTDEYRAAVEDIENTISGAEGWRDKSKAIFGAFAEHPAQFLGEYVVKELIQEVPLLLISGGTANVVKQGLKEAGKDFAKRYAARVAVGTDVALNMAEAYGATAASTYDEAYDVATKAGMSNEDAQKYAIELAQNTGALATVMAGATAGIGGAALAKSIFKTPDQQAAYQALIDKIQEGAKVTIKEGFTESIEEALPQLYSATMLSQIDPTYDVAGSVAASAVLGKIAGAGVAGGIYTGNAIADAAYSLNNNVKNIVDNASSASSGMSALQDLGFDTVTAGNLMNNRFDADFTTTAEAKAAFKEANPEFDTTDVDFDSYVNTNDADLAAEVASYVDPRYLDVDEVKAAAAAEGITLTDEQAAAYAGQKDESSAIDALRAEYDPQFTTAEEARAKFAELGFNPTDAQVDEFVREGSETDTLEAISDYVNPRQVTEAEARRFFEDQGYTPTDEEVAAYVGQGDENFETSALSDVGSYVDPRQVTEAEARKFFEDLGYTPTDQEIKDFTAQVAETDQQTAISEYVDPRFVTLDELQTIADQEGLTLTETLAATYLGQRDEASALEAAQGEFDPLATTFDEAKQFFESQGYTPTTEEIAQFVASATEEAQQSGIAEYVDPRQVTEDESRAFLEALGYTPTDEEVASFVGQLNDATYQSAQETAVGEYVDPRQTTEDEVRAAFEAAGFSPTDEEVATFVGQLNQAAQETAIGEYVDPRQTTEDEVRAAFDALGFTPTDEEVGLFVGQLGQSAQETAIGEYVDPRQTTEDEVRAAFEALGFTPTDEQVTQFVGQYNQSVQETAVGEYVDPRQTTEAEVRAAFDALGFTPTDAEVTQFVGQLDQAAQETSIGQFVDPRQVTDEEARQFFADLGYTPTDEQVAEFVAQVSETEQAAAIASYVDPRQVTLAEVQAIADEEGLTLTDALAATYVGQGVAENYAAEKLSTARAEYDPLATTLEEATEFFANTGYTATPEEIAQFVASKTEETQTSAIGAYVDPRQVTAEEAEEFLSAIGYQPSQADIDQFTGQLNDENYQVAQKAAIDEYVDPRFFSAGEVRAAYEELGLVDVTQEDVDRFVGQFDPESEDYDPAGFEAFQRAKLESYLPTATYNLISAAIGSPSVEDDPNTPEDESKEATGIYKAIEEGSAKDVALQEAIDALSTNLGLTETELLKQLGTTKTDLEKSIGDVETSLGEDISDLADVIGTPAVEDDPDTLDVDESQDPTGIFADIAELIANGATQDEAIQAVADNLGTTKTDLEKAIGGVETSLGEDISDLADVIGTPATDDAEATGIFADIAELIANGATQDEAIQAVADNLGTTKTDLEKAIGAVETSLGEDISGLADILGTPEVLDDPDTLDVDESQDPTGLFATIQQYENAGIERDEALSLAIGDVASALGTTETNLLDAIGVSKTDILKELGTTKSDILGELETGLGALEESFGADIDTIANIIGKPARDVTQTDIDFVADVIAQTEVLNEQQLLQYDVTGDGIVDINDQNLLTSALQGEDVTFADTSMFGPATGLYGTTADIQQQLQSDMDTQTDTITDILTQIQTQIQTNEQQQRAMNLLNQLSQPGMLQQDVSVKMPDPLQLRYLYDISGPSIFATPGQAQLFTSPFGGTRATPANMTAVPQVLGPSTAMTGMMPRTSGFAEGGFVDETEALLALLGDSE